MRMAQAPRNPATPAYTLPANRAAAKDTAHPYSIVNPGAKAGDDWSVKDICTAYEWPEPKQKQVSGGGKIALIHLAGGSAAGGHRPVLRRARAAGPGAKDH
jgi:hypothetical protein